MDSLKLLLFLFFGRISSTAPKTYQELLSKLNTPSKLVFDITSHTKNSDNFLPSQLKLESSPLTYYNYKRGLVHIVDFGNVSFWKERDYDYRFARSMESGTVSILYLTPTNDPSFRIPLTLDEMEVNANSTGIPPTIILQYKGQHTPQQYVYFALEKVRRRRLRFGLELPAVQIQKNGVTRDLIQVTNSVILDTSGLIPSPLLLSPSILQDYGKYLLPTIATVKNMNPNCTIYLKIPLPPPTLEEMEVWQVLNKEDGFIDGKLNKTRYFYTLQSLIRFLNGNDFDNNIGIIFEAFKTADSNLEGLDGSNLKNILIPATKPYLRKGEKYNLTLDSIIKQSSLHFGEIELSERSYYFPGDWSAPSFQSSYFDHIRNLQLQNFPTPQFSLPYELSQDGKFFAEDVQKILNNFQDLPLHLIVLDFSKIGNRVQSNIDEGLRLIPERLEIGCRVRFDTSEPEDFQVFQHVMQSCLPAWSKTSLIEFYFGLEDVTFFPENTGINRGPSWESKILHRIHSTLKPNPEKKIRLNFGDLIATPYYSVSLYCTTEMEVGNRKVEALANFGRIYNIPIKLKKVLNYGEDLQRDGSELGSSWWRPLKTLKEVNLSRTNFLPFVARSYPDNFLSGEFPTDPCLVKTIHIPEEGLSLNMGFGGTTVYLEDTPKITPEGMQTLFKFVFHKFSLAEIVPSSKSDLENVFRLISDEKFFERNGIEDAEVYLKVSSSILEEFNGKDLKINNILKGIQLTPSESIPAVLLEKLSKNGIKTGIDLEDCLHEVNGGFQTLKEIGKVDYVVCHVKEGLQLEGKGPDSKAIENYLDTHLYIRKYFESVFPGKETEFLFRLSLNFENPAKIQDKSDASVKNFLNFIGDLNQYAKAYKMKFFMFPALDSPSGNKFGWWRIDNFNDLGNSSVYIEKESEYLGKESWRPDPETEDFEVTPPIVLIISLISAVLLLLIAVFIVFLLRSKYNKAIQFISDKELDEFLNGLSAVQGQIEDDFEGNDYEDRKFPREYELQKGLFALEGAQILGKGNFGVVYKAVLPSPLEERGLNEGDSIAVKVPQVGGSKESFKSILSELKILCYIGKHPNVVMFVGAYIKEIRKGVIYVATELCEKGDLLNYLKKMENAFRVYSNIQSEQVNDLTRELTRLSLEIAQGMQYISEKKIVHGDLSARNILLDKDLTCKIADFGLSRKIYEYQEYVKKSSEPLPWRWMAPESLRHLKFTSKSDVWSFGVTVWEIFNLGTIPFPGRSWSVGFLEEIENGLRLQPPQYGSSRIYQILVQCWDNNPQERPDFKEIVDLLAKMIDGDYMDIKEKNQD